MKVKWTWDSSRDATTKSRQSGARTVCTRGQQSTSGGNQRDTGESYGAPKKKQKKKQQVNWKKKKLYELKDRKHNTKVMFASNLVDFLWKSTRYVPICTKFQTYYFPLRHRRMGRDEWFQSICCLRPQGGPQGLRPHEGPRICFSLYLIS